MGDKKDLVQAPSNKGLLTTAKGIGGVEDRFTRRIDRALGGGLPGTVGDITEFGARIKGDSELAELHHFANAVGALVGGESKGLVGIVRALREGLASYRKAVEFAADTYDENERLARKQFEKLDERLMERMGAKYAEVGFADKNPLFKEDSLTYTSSAAYATFGNVDAVGVPPKTDWNQYDYVQAYYLIMKSHPESVRDAGIRLGNISNSMRDNQEQFMRYVVDAVGPNDWEGDAATAFKMSAEKTSSLMRNWAESLEDASERVARVAASIEKARSETNDVADDLSADIDRITKSHQQMMDDLSGHQSTPNWVSADDVRKSYNDAVHSSMDKHARRLREIGGTLSTALSENSEWKKTGPYEGLIIAGALATPGPGPGGGPGAGPGAGPGPGPSTPPGGPKQNPNANPNLPKPNLPNSNLPKPTLPNPNLAKPTLPNLNPNQIPNPSQTPKLATPQLPTPSLGANPLAGSPQLPGGPTAMPAGVPELTRPTLPGANDLPGLSGPGATPLTPGVIPTLPGRSSTSPDVPSLTGRTRTPSSLSANPGGGGGVTLPGRGGGLTGPGPGGNDQTSLLPIAANGTDPETPLTVGPKAANLAPGDGGGGGGMPFMPPMGGMNPGAAAGSGGGGQPPRAVRRGGPRLVDQDTGNGPSALSGRTRDQRRDQPKVVKVETESWTPEQEPAQAPRQQQVRPTPGAV
ncbi:hypothetical protein GCM10027280_41770 [Micromonospora polyrhachis]|uniref:Uncharacterized protein YukE n=1 Tax=Micromonospora polyrhachis TaxID=1282883 RepID=A0A7W7SM21_9ACTN|nr:WXG100 family type VII secretion target [Micromonospora polyrhachis]MBB4957126.1 uncharacterized protein YukE [Micromonospora polyrhachis]